MLGRVLKLARAWHPLTVVAVIVLAIGAVQLVAGALAVGVTTDEPVHVDRASSWLDSGWYVPEDFMVDGRPRDDDYSSPYVYGPAYSALAHIANVVVGNEGIGEISGSGGAYKVRHLTVALLAVLTIAAVGFAVAFLTRSPRFGLWAAACLVAIPEWTGQSFFNPKDVPAACGYTLLTVGLVMALGGGGREEPPSSRRRFAVGALLAGGFFVAAGTRLSFLVPFLVSVAIYAALRLGQWKLGGVVRDGSMDRAVAGGAAAGIGAIAVLYPKVAISPFTLLTETISGSAGYPWRGFTLTAGQLLSEHPPWWYLPAWVGAALPLLLGGLAVLGVVLGMRSLLAARGISWRGPVWRHRELGLVLVIAQLLLLPLGAVVTGAVMYSGMRQHLYVLPAVAILAGVGARGFWLWLSAREPARTWRPTAIAILAIAPLFPVAEQTLLFPYNYVYVNPVAGIGGVNDRWETDYWFASRPEALSHVPRSAELLCSRYLVPAFQLPYGPLFQACRSAQTEPFADRRGTDVKDEWRDDNSATWVIGRKRAGNHPPDYCDEVNDVTRWLRGESVTMAFVLRCPP